MSASQRVPSISPDPQMVSVDAGQTVERDVRGQHLRHHSLRLESEHPPPVAHQTGEDERVGPDVGADVDDVVTWPAEPAGSAVSPGLHSP